MNLLRSAGQPALVIAHRGASAAAPENTMPAFEMAWSSGAQWVEADVQPSLEGVPVILHDETLDRTTTGTGPVRATPFAQLAALDAGSWFRPAGADFHYRDVRIPRLADLLMAVAEPRRLLLEVKGPHDRGQLQTVLAELRAAGADDRVFLQSFERPVLRDLQALQPRRPVGLLVEGRLDSDPVAACADLGATSYNPDHELLDSSTSLVADLHAAGIAVVVWTADDPADWNRLADIAVDGIITNQPAELLAWQLRR